MSLLSHQMDLCASLQTMRKDSAGIYSTCWTIESFRLKILNRFRKIYVPKWQQRQVDRGANKKDKVDLDSVYTWWRSNLTWTLCSPPPICVPCREKIPWESTKAPHLFDVWGFFLPLSSLCHTALAVYVCECVCVCSSNPSLCMCSYFLLNNYWSILFWQPLYHAGQLHKRPQANNNIVYYIWKYIDICTPKMKNGEKNNKFKKGKRRKLWKQWKKSTTPNPSWKCMNWTLDYMNVYVFYFDGFPSKSLDANVDALLLFGDFIHAIWRYNAIIWSWTLWKMSSHLAWCCKNPSYFIWSSINMPMEIYIKEICFFSRCVAAAASSRTVDCYHWRYCYGI